MTVVIEAAAASDLPVIRGLLEDARLPISNLMDCTSVYPTSATRMSKSRDDPS